MTDYVWSHEADIRRASTPPSWLYTSDAAWAWIAQDVFRRSWQFVADVRDVPLPGSCWPAVLNAGIAPEPVVAVRGNDDLLRVLSNVCTHRAAVVVDAPCRAKELKCRYHGRRFGLDGNFVAMPRFGEVENFPTEADNLAELDSARWGGMLFAAVRANVAFHAWTAGLDDRLAYLPWDELVSEPLRNRDYVVRANWALYVENYLEGFHIPFVHPGLNTVLDASDYETILLPHGVLQIGTTKGNDGVFELPDGHPDSGKNVAAWYYWLFPNLMINVYRWGVSVNIVEPMAIDRTRVRYRTYVWDDTELGRGAGADLDRVEREDGDIVESVQRGLRGSVYTRGRYSPTMETGTHHFHGMLHSALAHRLM
jgi:choline monooxygenase